MATDVVFIAQLSARVRRTERGYREIRKAADEARERLATPTRLTLAKQLIADPAPQVRMLGVCMLGDLAPGSQPALKLLRDRVSADADERVQAILAMAFDTYCAAIGYAVALPTIDAWLAHRSPNVRRAVAEGLRIWTRRPYFKENPLEAASRLSALRQDPSEAVRQAAELAFREIEPAHR
ncbi:MAG TPA: hypothetical protein PK954_03245 [Anaerolineales bacterium]|nr:hypothetical protein [Anaerolineales bacterium]HRF47340.1 hypothetical protein [Anaerolineales bacterium]